MDINMTDFVVIMINIIFVTLEEKYVILKLQDIYVIA